MSITLGGVIDGMRNLHPAFDASRVPAAPLASNLSKYQNTLIAKAVARDKNFLAQRLSVAIAFDSANLPGTAGVGTSGGLPGVVTSGAVARAERQAGFLVNPTLGTVSVAEEPVVDLSAVDEEPAWTQTAGANPIDDATGLLLVITAGLGAGQVRVITDGADGYFEHAAWTTRPDTTSQVAVYSAAVETDELAVITKIPSTAPRSGYLVRTDANGAAYIDYTQPLTTYVGQGIPLPQLLAILGATVRYADGEEPASLINSERRYDFDPMNRLRIYQEGNELFLAGEQTDWNDAESLEILYSPIAPDVTALSSLFLVPDSAEQCLIAYAGAQAAVRAKGLEPDLSIDVRMFADQATIALEDYLSSLRLSKRARITTFREGSY